MAGGSSCERESIGWPALAIPSSGRARRRRLPERIVIEDARRETGAALDRLEAACRAAGLDGEAVIDLRVVAEEVLTNVAKYAFEPDLPPALELSLEVGEAEAVLEFRDRGRPFDPLTADAPDLERPPEERPLGGLGLALVRALVDEASYAREGGANRLRLVKRRTAQ
jgi:anti-sigma regulatory factor (Ser/Thr protein kinase)